MTNEPLQWVDRSNSFDGKQLRTIIKLDEDTILDCSLYYRQHVPANTQYWQMSREDLKAAGYETVLHVSKMRNAGLAFTGGIGDFFVQDVPHTTRRTIKGLQEQSLKLTRQQIIDLAKEQSTQPTRIV